MKKWWPIVAVIIIVILALSSTFTVHQGHTAVLLQFGRIDRANFAPGLYFKIPFVQQAVPLDTRIQELNAQPESYFTKEKKTVEVDFYVKWRIANTVTYYESTGGDPAQARMRLAPIIKDALRFQVNSRTLDDLISGGRKGITDEVIKQANKATLKNLGIRIVDVRIQRIELPNTVSQSVYQRMRAERKKLANELRSTGHEAGEKIRADADRQRKVLLAQAKGQAVAVRGEGDADAAKIYANAYQKDPAFFDFYRSLRAYRNAFGSGKSVLILNPKSQFLKYFSNPGSAATH